VSPWPYERNISYELNKIALPQFILNLIKAMKRPNLVFDENSK
jgi:hypothetical protein